MPNSTFDLIDNFLIDQCFQPICDRVRRVFGWSKRVPVVFMKALTILGLTPLCGEMMVLGGVFYIFAIVMIVWILVKALLIKILIEEEISESRLERTYTSQALDGYRVWGKNERKQTFLLSIFIIPFVLGATLIPEYRFVIGFYLMGCFTNLFDLFFRACSDLPKGKSVFEKLRERIWSSTRSPVPQ